MNGCETNNVDYDVQKTTKDIIVIDNGLCDSCITKGCIFQFGIVRNHCDFYKAEMTDNAEV